MFEMQRKCNKQKLQGFVDEYGIYFTCEAGFALVKNIKNPVSLVK
jgi:hypothetical protein